MNNETNGSNILAGLCSFIFPGLGQLLLNRVGEALVWFLAFVATSGLLIAYCTDPYSSYGIGLFFLSVLALLPHIVSAYFAANGPNKPQASTEKKEVSAELNFDDYASYQEWCQENGHEPMPLLLFEKTFRDKL